MPPFEFAKAVANSTEVQGAECKIAPHDFCIGSVDEKTITMQLLVENYPKIIYDMGNLQIEPISKNKEKQRGLFAK